MISYANRRDNLVAIKDIRNFDVNDTITFPISGYKDDRLYQSEYKFMPLVSSPGVAFIVVEEPPGTSANAVFNSVLSGWPVLVLTLLMALLSGMIMWVLVSASYHRLNYCLFHSEENSLRLLYTTILFPFTHVPSNLPKTGFITVASGNRYLEYLTSFTDESLSLCCIYKVFIQNIISFYKYLDL